MAVCVTCVCFLCAVAQAAGVLPLHDFSLFAAAAAALAAEGPGRPTTLLGPAPDNKELSHKVVHDIVGGPRLWAMLGAAGVGTATGSAFTAAAAAANAEAEAAAAGAPTTAGGALGSFARLLQKTKGLGSELRAEVRRQYW